MDMDSQRQSTFYNYQIKRRIFARKCYFSTILFMLLALIQWNIFYYIRATHVFFAQYYGIGIICFMAGLFLFSIFIFFENVRFSTPCNWIVALIQIECIIIGVTSLIVRHYHYEFILSFIIWALVLALFLCCGAFLPHDLTLDIVVLFILAVLSIIAGVYFLMLYIVANIPYTFFAYRAFIIISVLLFVMHHAQIIHGGGFAELRLQDHILAALILFHDFLLLFLFTFQFAPRWSDQCDMQKNSTSWMVLDHWHSHLPFPEYPGYDCRNYNTTEEPNSSTWSTTTLASD